MATVNVSVRVVKVASSFLGITKLGGIVIRGRRANTELGAVMNTCAALADSNNEDAVLGLDMEMQGTTLEKVSEQASLPEPEVFEDE